MSILVCLLRTVKGELLKPKGHEFHSLLKNKLQGVLYVFEKLYHDNHTLDCYGRCESLGLQYCSSKPMFKLKGKGLYLEWTTLKNNTVFQISYSKTFDIYQSDVCYCQASSTYPLAYLDAYQEILYTFETLKYAFHVEYTKMDKVLSEKVPKHEFQLVTHVSKWKTFMQDLFSIQNLFGHYIHHIHSVETFDVNFFYFQMRFHENQHQKHHVELDSMIQLNIRAGEKRLDSYRNRRILMRSVMDAPLVDVPLRVVLREKGIINKNFQRQKEILMKDLAVGSSISELVTRLSIIQSLRVQKGREARHWCFRGYVEEP
ncbi:hypothetical protein HMI54_000308 [Coelomomyces lativittatus]|nr:hypothetical protein HMI56_006526 [Coelomomyces lativittatus]KAJ1512065.1 hypothetical protein HMI54_000308 [Coelomomyces lativittatus]KAJ1514056.1 hypothetical protein HMI55_004999 [Coelomomyces lativittatus]